MGGIIFRIQIQVMGSEEGGGSFWATFGGGSNGAEVAATAPRNFDGLTPTKHGDPTNKNGELTDLTNKIGGMGIGFNRSMMG